MNYRKVVELHFSNTFLMVIHIMTTIKICILLNANSAKDDTRDRILVNFGQREVIRNEQVYDLDLFKV